MPNPTRFQPLEPLVPDRFREARLARGMTASELADKISVSRQSISKYELGISEPTDPVVDEIAFQLNIPISFFYKPLTAPANRGTTYFRSLKTNAARAKEVLSVKSEWAIQIANVLSEDIRFPKIDLPGLDEKYAMMDSYSLDDIEDITMSLREHWSLGSSPIPNMARLLESHGFVIATINSGYTETDACSSIIDGRPFIFLDTQKECAVRTRFNMAHELGHLLLHGNVSQADLEQKEILNRIEHEANCFASCFLLPRAAFLLDIRSTSLQAFLPLKRKWKVSIQAMVYRCRELEVFSDSQMIYIQKQISSKRWRRNEPYDDEWPCESSSILRTSIKMLIERGDYTKEQFVSLFRISPIDIEELCSLPSGFLSNPVADNSVLVDFVSKKVIR
ncbi:MAG: XRE family transcriptional regulator [Pseudoflavonifractor sp.]|nr:XRE family transcriptional regulator [Pseudoflavonifractor sp.]